MVMAEAPPPKWPCNRQGCHWGTGVQIHLPWGPGKKNHGLKANYTVNEGH